MTQPGAGAGCQVAPSPVSEMPVERALIPALENWIVRGVLPPASQYPTVAAGTLVAPSKTGFPDLSDISVPNGAAATPVALSLASHGVANWLALTDYSDATPVVDATRHLQDPRAQGRRQRQRDRRHPDARTRGAGGHVRGLERARSRATRWARAAASPARRSRSP